jgi:hypothetical protein
MSDNEQGSIAAEIKADGSFNRQKIDLTLRLVPVKVNCLLKQEDIDYSGQLSAHGHIVR